MAAPFSISAPLTAPRAREGMFERVWIVNVTVKTIRMVQMKGSMT